MKRITLAIIVLMIAGSVQAAHPNIILTPTLITSLQAEYLIAGSPCSTLVAWCDANMATDPATWMGTWASSDERRLTAVGNAVNFALAYVITEDDTFADEAMDVCEELFAMTYTGGWNARNVMRNDYWYTYRFGVPPVAIVLDWCYAALTAAEVETLTVRLDEWGGDFYSVRASGSLYIPGGSVDPVHNDEPMDNYFQGYQRALYFVALALDGTSEDTNAATYEVYADTMIVRSIRSTRNEPMGWAATWGITGANKGGMWCEGTGYGKNAEEWLCNSVWAYSVRHSTTANALGFGNPEEWIAYQAHSLFPNKTFNTNPRTWTEGDANVGDNFVLSNTLTTLAATVLCTDADTIAYAYRLLTDTNVFTFASSDAFKLPWYALYWDSDVTPAADLTDLAETYHLDGQRALFYKGSWAWNDQTAPYVDYLALRLGCGRADHASNGMGNFHIYSGNSLVIDAGAELSANSYIDEWYHNGLYVAAHDTSTNNSTSGRYDRFNVVLGWNESDVEHNENTTAYLYYAGDMSPIHTDANMASNARGTHVKHKEKEWFYIKADKALMELNRARVVRTNTRNIWDWRPGWATSGTRLDVSTARDSDGEAMVQHRVYTRTSPIDSNATDDSEWRIDGGTGSDDMMIKRWYPSAGVWTGTYTLSTRYCLVDTLTTPTENHTWLHSYNILPADDPLTYVSGLSVTAGNVVAGGFQSASNANYDYICLFSTDLEGDADTGFESGQIEFSYTSPRDTSVVYVMNCTPSTDYYWLAGETIDIRTTTFEGAATATSSAGGVLVLNGEATEAAPDPDPEPATHNTGRYRLWYRCRRW